MVTVDRTILSRWMKGNELWSYGEEAFTIMKKQLDLRLSLKPYIEKLMKEAAQTGAPLLRTLFY